MSNDSNVIPFRKRAPAETELDSNRMTTREWHPEVRRLTCPESFGYEESFRDDE